MVVFKNDVNTFTSRKKRLEYLEDNSEWQETIKFFRSNKGRMSTVTLNITIARRKQLEKSEYIFGPIADGGIIPPSNGRWRQDPPRAINPKKYQICLTTPDIAEAFFKEGQNVEEVIFLLLGDEGDAGN